MGQTWSALSDSHKEPYNNLAAQDKIRYENELSEFKEKGYFINASGENSQLSYKPKVSKVAKHIAKSQTPIQMLENLKISDETTKSAKL